MRIASLACCAAIILGCAGCGSKLTRSDVQEASGEKRFFADDSNSLLLTDSMRRNVGAWYRQTYRIWTADHKRLYYEVEKRSPRGVKNSYLNVMHDLGSMRSALSEDDDIARIDKLVREYEWIHKKGRARQATGQCLYKLDKIRKEIRRTLSPGSVNMVQRELEPDEPDPEKTDEKEDTKTGKVKPKW